MAQPCKTRQAVRPWIAMVAAYALALQVLLSGLAAGHFMAIGDVSPSDLFVICHGNGDGSADGQNLPDKSPLSRPPCVLCTLSAAPCAILPAQHAVANVNALMTSNVVPRNDGRIFEFDSPTGQYQRGPPARISVFG